MAATNKENVVDRKDAAPATANEVRSVEQLVRGRRTWVGGVYVYTRIAMLTTGRIACVRPYFSARQSAKPGIGHEKISIHQASPRTHKGKRLVANKAFRKM